LKLTFCLVRHPDLTRTEFQRYWREEHAPKVNAARKALGIVRYVQCHTVLSSSSEPLGNARGMHTHSGAHEYDGVAELYWESEQAFSAASQTADGRRHGAILLADERQFIDLPKSRIFLTESHEIQAA